MIDILYILGGRKMNYDMEIICSLRTLNKYVQDAGRIFITGEIPPSIDESTVIFTEAKDIGCPTINHWHKVNETIKKTDIGEKFVLMYDDIFFTKPTSLTEYPHYQKGKLGESYEGGWEYRKSLTKAEKWLTEHQMSTYNFELHVPFIYERTKFQLLEPVFQPLIKDPIGMAVRSIYGNRFAIDIPYKNDVKIRARSDVNDEKIMGQECISASDYTFPFIVAPHLEQHVQERSPWEK